MPIDPFFTSAVTKHFVEDKEVTDLKRRLADMSYEERREWFWQFARANEKGRSPTWVEGIVMKNWRFCESVKRKGKIHSTGERAIEKAMEEYKSGKRDKVMMFGGYGTTSGCSAQQRRSRRVK